MLRTLLVLTAVLASCESSSPCSLDQRLAENERDGAKIQYCVRRDDGRAQGHYSCTLSRNRGTVVGEFDANFKHGEWRHSIAGKLVRTERWHNDVLKEVKTLGEAGTEKLECDGHVIAPHPHTVGD